MADTQAVAVVDKRFATVRDMLLKMEKQIMAAAAGNIDFPRFARVAMTQISLNDTLLKCDARSLIGALMECAQFGLEPDGIRQLAHLVPFWNSQHKRFECELILGYKGLRALALRNPDLRDVYAREVYEGDDFSYEYGLNEKLDHRPKQDFSEQPGAVIACYAIGRFRDGETRFLVMPRWQLDSTEKRAVANKRNLDRNPWTTDKTAMQRKTVLRALCGQLPGDEAVSRAVAIEARKDDGTPAIDLAAFAPPEVLSGPIGGEPADPPADEGSKPVRKVKETVKPAEPEKPPVQETAPAQPIDGAPAPGPEPATETPLSDLTAGDAKAIYEDVVAKMLEVDTKHGRGTALKIFGTLRPNDKFTMANATGDVHLELMRALNAKLSEAKA